MAMTRRKRVVLILALAAPLVLVGAAFVAAENTRSNSFCGLQCHEMLPYYRTWQASNHRNVDCVRCHIPPGVWNYAKTKFFALREVWVHFTKKDVAPIAVTRHIPNAVCTRCHAARTTAAAATLAAWTRDFTHGGHAKVPRCVDCHARMVHEPIAGVVYLPPRTMAACFECHDGKQQPNACTYCHTSPHEARGECQGCHNLRSWQSHFTHRPPLVAAHAKTPCELCHTQSTSTAMGFPAGCLGCHRAPHPLRLANLDLTRCASCHTIEAWFPSTFAHPTSGCVNCHGNHHGDPRTTQCQLCHSQRTWLGASHPTSSCTACHTTGPLHSGVSSQCRSCHVPGRYWVPSTFVHQQVGPHVPSGEERLACTACHTVTYAAADCSRCHGPGGPGGG